MMLRDEPYSLTEGRFDVGIGEDRFYRLRSPTPDF